MPSIKKNKNGTYRIRVSCGADFYGKQNQPSMTWKPPRPGMSEAQIQKELMRTAILFEEAQKAQMHGNITFADLCRTWLDDYAAEHLKPRTVEEYRRYCPRVYRALGKIKLDELKAEHFRRFYKQLSQPGANMKNGQPLSAKTILNYHTFCSAVCEFAVKNELMEKNPCRNATPKRGEKAQIKHMEREQLGKFLHQLDKEPIEDRVFFTISLLLGTRKGETLGLEWQDIDFERGTLTIARTSQYTPERGIFTGTPKTAGSYRTLGVPQSLLQLLWRYRIAQRKHMEELGDTWTHKAEWAEHPRLFTALDGSPMHPSLPTKRMNAIYKRAGLPHFPLHSMRHTAATWLIEQGTDIRTVSGILGHSQTSTTMNIYAELIQSTANQATSQLADTFEEMKQEAEEEAEVS